jgi:hypothetical protein
MVMRNPIIKRVAPFLLVAQMLLSVFPTAGHFHITGGVRADLATVGEASPGSGQWLGHNHTLFTCVIHLIAASYVCVEESSEWSVPPTTAAPIAETEVRSLRLTLSTPTDGRAAPLFS